MATISVTYTPNYQGCHRINFSIDGDAPYFVFTDYSASVIGEPKTTNIEVTEEFITTITAGVTTFCSATTGLEIAIQACCADPTDGSTFVRGTGIFDVDTPCTYYSLTCSRAGIEIIALDDVGSGYDPLNPPNVVITAASGAGATATAAVNPDGTISEIVVTNSGDGYAPVLMPTVTIDAPPGPGTQATAEVIKFTPCGGLDGTVAIKSCPFGNVNTLTAPQPNQTYYVCATGSPNLTNAGIYATATKVVGSTACCDCQLIRLTNTDKESITVFYINCDGVIESEEIEPAGSESTGYIDRCMVSGTAYTTSPPSYLAQVGIGPC